MRFYMIFSVFIFITYARSESPEEYITNEIDGHGYKLIYTAEPWTRAKDKCTEIGAKLSVPKSEAEFRFIQKIVRSMKYPDIIGSRYKLLVWLGIYHIDNHTTWTNVDGENIEDTGFHTWAGQNGLIFSANPAEPHCVGMDAANYGLRSYWCHHHQPYICEININSTTLY
ncbi:CD209 antigen-like [Achroia grisella]|uniref:CD209 antigen-like n=1 Tax=Achroia grisella TaxID=688607 RepID=UPI0027D2AF88|nr:CD209 antigen-like [Achroia grisella]